jgi:hypothetical protein
VMLKNRAQRSISGAIDTLAHAQYRDTRRVMRPRQVRKDVEQIPQRHSVSNLRPNRDSRYAITSLNIPSPDDQLKERRETGGDDPDRRAQHDARSGRRVHGRRQENVRGHNERDHAVAYVSMGPRVYTVTNVSRISGGPG